MGDNVLNRDQDFTTTVTETELTNSDEINKLKKENEHIIDILKQNNIDIDELLTKKNNDSVFLDIENSESSVDIKLKNKKNNNEIVPKHFKEHIIETIIRPNLENDINESSKSRFNWANTATAMSCISEILMVIQTALSFTAASYQLILISYLAGVIGVVAIGFSRFGAYSRNQSNQQNTLYNKLLKKIGITTSMPNLLEDDSKNNKSKN